MKLAALLALTFLALLTGCVPQAESPGGSPEVRLRALRDAALSWHSPPAVSQIGGLRLLDDAPRPAPLALAVVRFIRRANPRLDSLDALMLADIAIARAQGVGIDPAFFCATLLQESAFSPWALSSAAAVGIAQFTLETAAAYGVDPFDWRDALRGSSFLLASYVETYHHAREDEYVLALAAYNAGPGAVDRYGGVPPYPETREYIGDIIDRWARIERWEQP